MLNKLYHLMFYQFNLREINNEFGCKLFKTYVSEDLKSGKGLSGSDNVAALFFKIYLEEALN